MSDRYPIPAGFHETELIILKSRFISCATYTPTVEEAKTFIAEVRQRHAQASHNVYAFAVGYGASVTHGMTDDGEPSGTAGKPTFAVVKGCGLGDVTVVTTRYFGGTKLGTGGLVKAYTESAQLVLSELPRTQKIEKQTVLLGIPYNLYERVKLIIPDYEGEVDDEDFGVDIALTLTFPVSQIEGFSAVVSEMSAGQVQVET